MSTPPCENTPLLVDAAHQHDNATEHSIANKEETPLPHDQMALICFARVIDPMIAFALDPYLNAQIESLGVAEENLGFYSGLIVSTRQCLEVRLCSRTGSQEALLCIVKVISLIPWTSAAERFARRPIVIISLLGNSAGSFGFGLSQSIPQLIYFRCLTGFFAGTEPCLRVLLTEHTDETNRARAYGYFANTNNVGVLLGPLLGGVLADPVARYPKLFGGSSFLAKYPYSLPMLVMACLAILAAATTAAYVQENPISPLNDLGPASSDDSSSNTVVPPSPPSGWSVVMHKEVVIVIAVYVSTFAVAFGYTQGQYLARLRFLSSSTDELTFAVNPLFFYTNTRLGGFGFSPLQISIWMAVAGVSQTLWMFFPFPAIQKRIGTAGTLRLCAIITPIVYATGPLLQPLRRTDAVAARIVFYAGLAALQTVGMSVAMSYEAVSLAVNDVSPDSAALSKITSVAMTLNTSVQAIAFWGSNALYAFSVGHRILGGQLAWVVLVTMAVGVAGFVWTALPKRIVPFK